MNCFRKSINLADKSCQGELKYVAKVLVKCMCNLQISITNVLSKAFTVYWKSGIFQRSIQKKS